MARNRFIERPVLSICISIVIVFIGLLALNGLSVEKFPNIAPPTVRVSATYMGASAETVQKAVIIPLEESINGVENMTYMESTATAGQAYVSIYFKQGIDADMAAVNVQNKVSEATGLLPSEVTQVGVTVRKRQTSQLAIIGVYSPDDRFDEKFIANYLNINVVPQIQRVNGVGDVNVMGANYSMRIWLNPEKMANYGLVPSDITAVLGEQNIEASTGSFGENSDNVFTYTMKYRGRYETPEEFGEFVIRSTADGEVLKLKDVAEIELGKMSYSYVGGLSGAFIPVTEDRSMAEAAEIGALTLEKLEVENVRSSTLTYDFTEEQDYRRFRFSYLPASGSGGTMLDNFTFKTSKKLEYVYRQTNVMEIGAGRQTDTVLYLGNLKPGVNYYYKVQATDMKYNDFTGVLMYDNVTDYSNTIEVKTLETGIPEDLNPKHKERWIAVSVRPDNSGYVAYVPEVLENHYLYIYTINGSLVASIPVTSNEIVIPQLTNGQIYIIKYSAENDIKRKDKYAKFFYNIN